MTLNESIRRNSMAFVLRLSEKRKRRMALKKSKKGSSSSLSCPDERRRVRFGRDSVAVYEMPAKTDTKEQLWYNKSQLHTQFLQDLEASLLEQVRRVQCASVNAEYSFHNDSETRGLELHLIHNQRRKEKAEAYVKHIVEKSYEMRKEKRRRSAQQHAEQIQEYCSQLTWMARDLALGVAAADEREARSIYGEVDDNSDAESFSTATDIEEELEAGKDDFVRTSSMAYRPSQARALISYTAKSA